MPGAATSLSSLARWLASVSGELWLAKAPGGTLVSQSSGETLASQSSGKTLASQRFRGRLWFARGEGGQNVGFSRTPDSNKLPQVLAEFMWESSARVVVDFNVGGGMNIRAALTMNTKLVGFCFNDEHLKLTQAHTVSWIADKLKSKKGNLTPADYERRLEAARDPREVAWAAQKKRKGGQLLSETPEAKRRASNMESMVSDLLNTNQKPEPKVTPKPAPKPSPPQPKADPERPASSGGGALRGRALRP